MNYEKIYGDYLFSNNKSLLQVDVIHNYLSKESYWAQNIPLNIVEKSIFGSICFGVYFKGKQIGFARVVTDEASFGYLADVFILQEHRRKSLSKELMAFVLDFEPLKNLRRFMLATKDAHSLYSQFGFKPLAEPARFMEMKAFEIYQV